jgi:glutathione synthase/RimK-type ligase-like ATP-grasp enzyme
MADDVSLGAVRTPVVPPSEACELTLAAASAVEIDVAGVDLFPVGGSFVPLELNGAADFDESYSLPGGRSVFDELLTVLSAELLSA